MTYRDLPTNSLYPDDPDIIREVSLDRYVIYLNNDGRELASGIQYPDRTTANQWAKSGQKVVHILIKRYVLVDPSGNRRSHWCLTKEQCEDFAVAYAPQNRPNFGKDEYEHA